MVLTLISAVLFGSCKKDYSEADDYQTYYLKSFGSNNNEGFGFLNACKDGHLYTGGWISTDSIQYILQMDYDRFGKKINSSQLAFESPSAYGSRLSDGTFILGNRGYDWKARFDADGKKMGEFEDPSGGYNYWHTRPILLENGQIGYGLSNGITSSTSQSYLVELNGDMTFNTGYPVSDQDMDGKVLQVMYDKNDGNVLSFSGNMYRNPWDFSSPIVAFTARIDLVNQMNSVLRFAIPADSGQSTYVVDRVVTNDGSLVQLFSSGFYYLTNGDSRCGSYFEMMKWSEDRQTVHWRNKYSIGLKMVVPYAMTQTNQGDFIIVGSTRNGQGDTRYPFVVKIDKDGNLLENKIFFNLFDGTFRYGYQESNGDFYFAGEMELFGKKSTGSDAIIVKTDAQLNFNK